jgi:hypothetical protein
MSYGGLRRRIDHHPRSQRMRMMMNNQLKWRRNHNQALKLLFQKPMKKERKKLRNSCWMALKCFVPKKKKRKLLLRPRN